LADEKWGRFKTIAIFGTLYLVGDFLLAIAAHPKVLGWTETEKAGVFARSTENVGTSTGLFLVGLFICLGIGTGAIKSNVITLGADQFNPNDAREESQKVTFFSYFYWCINFGAAFAYGYLATLCVKGSASISQDYGYFACFMICACVMAVAILMFFAGSSRYIKMPPNSDAMSKLVRVLVRGSRHSPTARYVCVGFGLLIASFVVNFIAVFLKKGSDERLFMSYFAGILAFIGCVCWVIFGMNYEGMNKAKASQGGSLDDASVDEIKMVVRVLPFAALRTGSRFPFFSFFPYLG